LTSSKPPVIDGLLPDESYDLDDNSVMDKLQLNQNSRLKIADNYNHYPKCDWAVMEYKSRSLKDCVKQLEVTAERLKKVGRDVDLAIVVSNGMNSAEKHLFRKRKNILYSKITKKPIQIKTKSNPVIVQIYYNHEIENQYKKYKRSLAPWVYK